MTPKRRHYAIATSTRADWGLLSPIAAELRRGGAEVTVIATNMHLLPSAGMTVDEIISDGFTPLRVPVPADGSPAEIAAAVLSGFAEKLTFGRFDAIIVLGDRFEMVSVAQAAVMAGVPIIHIAGGTVSEGAFDDCFRHAITKMAWLHLPETEAAARRIVQMGEDPNMVVATGAIGVENILTLPLMSRQELEESLGFALRDKLLLVTIHHATLSSIPLAKQYDMMFKALTTVPEYQVIFTYPNNDVDSRSAIDALHTYQRLHSDRVHVVPSLGRLRYLSMLQYVDAVAGNSSSGLVEVPSMGVPTLDIGHRQDGREHGPSVVRCGETADEIAEGLRQVLSPRLKALADLRVNPYHMPDTLRRMMQVITSTPLPYKPRKHFHDL